MNKYNSSKIYKIKCLNSDKIYIGSTTENLKQRISRHKRHYESYLEGKHNYISSFDIIKDNNYEIELIEDCNVNTKDELRLREQHHISLNENCINIYKAFRTTEDLKNKRDKDNLLYKTRHPEEYKNHSLKRNIKIKCNICNNEVSQRNIARHQKSSKCKK